MKTLRIPLRIVFYKEAGDWIAHCLEFDLCGDGPSKEEALTSLGAAIQIQVEDSLDNDNLANLFTPADGEIFEKFFAGKDTAAGELHLQFAASLIIERIEFREYSEDRPGSGRELAPAS